jgi:hypothetical protein
MAGVPERFLCGETSGKSRWELGHDRS